MFCPKCGDMISDAAVPICMRGRMPLSVQMANGLRECFVEKSCLPKEIAAKKPIGGIGIAPGAE